MAVKQSQVDKLYAGLKDLARERRAKLDEALQLFTLNREIGDLEQWISEKEVVASSQDLGQDYDHVTVSSLITKLFIAYLISLLLLLFFIKNLIYFIQLLWERFKQFARDTEAIGTERVRSVNAMADQLISNGHNDSAIIAEHKDGLNESWQDLLELIDTRTQVNYCFSDI